MKSSTSALLAAPLLFSSALSQHVTGFSIPSQVAMDVPITANIASSSYIQNIQPISMVFGISPAAVAHLDALGSYLIGHVDLYDGVENATVVIPNQFQHGDEVVTSASLLGIVGAQLQVYTSFHNASVVVADAVGGELVFSQSEGF